MNNKDPDTDAEGQLIIDLPDPGPQHHQILCNTELFWWIFVESLINSKDPDRDPEG